jgi:hypothetical protein
VLSLLSLIAGNSAVAGGPGTRPDRTRNLELVASHDLGGAGFNTDVWALGKYAYVGTWGVFGAVCPAGGVKVIDISKPANPKLVNTIPAPFGTQTNDVKAARIDSKHFHGDVLAVSNEDCDVGGARGVEFWDVSNPLSPVYLSRYGPASAFDIPPDWLSIGFGVHNTYIFKQKGRTYLGLVVDGAEIFQFLFGIAVADMVGDFRILDITDPKNPVEVGDWGLVKNLGQDPFAGQGTDSVLRLIHDVWVENGIAYVSYWDGGLVLLDVSDPSDPKLISQTNYPSSEEGNTHVAVPARGGNLVITGDEDFTPGPWGFMRIFDTSDPTAPKQISTFATPNTLAAPPPVGDYSMHNVVVRGNTLYVSWYSDGVRVIDISDPYNPREIGSYVPPDTADPNGFWPTKAVVWGIYVHGDLILASDINSGLHILKHTK